ncbi:ABC transporter ATP-binding protein [Phenylobacterium sp.]|uniref:ABC transporter ATP-binding protein n=1 Tax=Phenylobacterium sp. TaxID=1871053 RepID=UPI00122875C4|nr:ABC transporter ATP-binding protein [Phenylobacterium sp.]THD58581.1 MAG: ABC transporter ATP-binding protein [Phenylobacterium sp.]
MSEKPPIGRGAGPSSAPTVDVSAMPAVLSRIARLALRYPWRMALTFVTSLLAALASLMAPQLIGGSIDAAHRMMTSAVHPGDAAAVKALLMRNAFLILAATSLRGVLTLASGYQSEYLSQRVALDLRTAFFQQLQRLSFGFHDRIHSGDLITRGMLDLEGARALINGAIFPAVSLVLLAAFVAWRMLALDPVMTLIGLGFIPFAGASLGRMGFRLRVTWLRVQQLMSALTLAMEENLQGIRVVRAFAGRAFELGKYDAAANAVLTFQYRRITLRFAGVLGMQVSFYISLGLLLWYGGTKVLAGQMTPGRLTEFVAYMMLLLGPIRQIAIIFNSMARATSSGGRLFEILDLQPEVADAPNAEPLRPTEGTLRFEHVDFRYDPAGRQVLSDISFEVGAGKTLGIVGPPGSGKSTIANLIPRFYDVSGGRITIDGTDIREVTLASLREYVGLVQQEAFLFDASVGHNVAYADPWAEDARIEGAARTAQIHDHIAGLPGAYETRVGERGVALSGGQRQRMSIARGVVPGPGVMVFDDSTAAIDAVTERKVREALAQATAAKATVIIAHRLSSLMHADEILLLDEGRIVERGTHDELVARGGVYADLFELQSRMGSDLEDAA